MREPTAVRFASCLAAGDLMSVADSSPVSGTPFRFLCVESEKQSDLFPAV